MIMLKARLFVSRNYFVGYIVVVLLLASIVVLLGQSQRASAGSAPKGSCSISAWQNGSNPLSWGFRMSINAPDAQIGSVMGGHPGVSSPWIPYITNPNINVYHTYPSAGNKTVYGRYSYNPQGSAVRVEVQCSRTITARAPVSPPPTIPPPTIPPPTIPPPTIPPPTIPPPPTTEPVRGCTDRNAANYNASAQVEDGSCQYPPTTTITASCAKSGNTTYAVLTLNITASDRNNNIRSVWGVQQGRTMLTLGKKRLMLHTANPHRNF
jgi:hypothetical protein